MELEISLTQNELYALKNQFESLKATTENKENTNYSKLEELQINMKR